MKYFLIIALLFLPGCASVTEIQKLNPDTGRMVTIYKVKALGEQKTLVKDEKIQVEVDNKRKYFDSLVAISAVK